MGANQKKMGIWKLTGVYTLAFCVMICAVFGVFFATGRSFIRTGDGLNQYFTALSYYRELLCGIIGNLFAPHQAAIPMFDMNIGYGGDILTTLHYYGIGEPLCLLSVLFSAESMEACFQLLFVLRLYLAGLFFAMFCRRHGHTTAGIVLGSMIYLFSGYTLYLVTNYVMFAVPLICLPLIFMGIDDVLEKKSASLYIASVFLSAISSFYFFYMVSIVMVLYAVMRFLYLYSLECVKSEGGGQEERRIEQRGGIKRMFFAGLNHLWRFAIYYLAGGLLSMPVLLPVIMEYLKMGRSGISYPIPLLYEPIAYAVNFFDLFYNFNGGRLGYSLLFLPVLIIIFRKKTHWIYRAVVFIMALFLCIPFLSSMMNGFAYVTNRYQFALAFAAAYLISRFFENIFELSCRERMFVTAVTICLILLAGILVDDKRILLCIVLCSAGVILLLWSAERFRRAVRVGVPFLALGSIVLLSNMQYRMITADSILNYLGRGRALGAYQGSQTETFIRYASEHEEVYANVTGGGAARFAQKEPYELSAMNSALLTGIHGMQFYFSLYNNNVAVFNRSLAVNAMNDFRYSGVEGRSILLHLLNAGYLLVGEGEEAYGFEPLSDGEGRILYSTVESGLGYTYRRTLSPKEWEKMNVVERQYAMLQAAVIDEGAAASNIPVLSARDLSQTYKEPGYVCRAAEGIAVSDGEWNVTDTDAVLTISVESWQEELRDSLAYGVELYVLLEGVDYAGDAACVTLDFSANNGNSQLTYLTDKDATYTGRHDFVCNLGLTREEVKEIQVTFDNKGIYSFDSMKIICQPMIHVDAYYDALFEEKLEEVEIDTNVIRGKIRVSGDKLFVLAVPYSEGFRAYVDGQQAALMKVNEMMMGLNLTAGEHEIVFRYTTPGLKAGWLLCLCGSMICAGIVLCRRRERRNHEIF